MYNPSKMIEKGTAVLAAATLFGGPVTAEALIAPAVAEAAPTTTHVENQDGSWTETTTGYDDGHTKTYQYWPSTDSGLETIHYTNNDERKTTFTGGNVSNCTWTDGATNTTTSCEAHDNPTTGTGTTGTGTTGTGGTGTTGTGTTGTGGVTAAQHAAFCVNEASKNYGASYRAHTFRKRGKLAKALRFFMKDTPMAAYTYSDANNNSVKCDDVDQKIHRVTDFWFTTARGQAITGVGHIANPTVRSYNHKSPEHHKDVATKRGKALPCGKKIVAHEVTRAWMKNPDNAHSTLSSKHTLRGFSFTLPCKK